MQQVAVVTGGARGIGLALARASAAHGMAVVVCDVAEEALAAAVGELEDDGAAVLGVAADVRDPVAMAGLRDAAFARFGRADLVSLNAGVALRRDVADMSEADWDWILDINLRGVIRGVTAFLPALEEQGSRAHPGDRVVPRPRRRSGVLRLLRDEVGDRGADGDALPRAAAEGVAGRRIGALSRLDRDRPDAQRARPVRRRRRRPGPRRRRAQRGDPRRPPARPHRRTTWRRSRWPGSATAGSSSSPTRSRWRCCAPGSRRSRPTAACTRCRGRRSGRLPWQHLARGPRPIARTPHGSARSARPSRAFGARGLTPISPIPGSDPWHGMATDRRAGMTDPR